MFTAINEFRSVGGDTSGEYPALKHMSPKQVGFPVSRFFPENVRQTEAFKMEQNKIIVGNLSIGTIFITKRFKRFERTIRQRIT